VCVCVWGGGDLQPRVGQRSSSSPSSFLLAGGVLKTEGSWRENLTGGFSTPDAPPAKAASETPGKGRGHNNLSVSPIIILLFFFFCIAHAINVSALLTWLRFWEHQTSVDRSGFFNNKTCLVLVHQRRPRACRQNKKIKPCSPFCGHYDECRE